MIFEVGKSYPDMRMKPDGVFLSIDDSGLLITVLMDSPSKEEKRAFHQNSAFSVAAGRIFDLLFLCVKFGSLSWMDCTYTPHLGYTPLLPDVPDGLGYAAIIRLFDTRTGLLCSQRLVSIDTLVSRYIRAQIEEIKKCRFDVSKYHDQINMVYNTYSTMDLLAHTVCRFDLEVKR